MAVAVASPAFAASPPADPTDPAGTCFKGSASYVRDLLYVGPINTLRNTIFFIDSVGGTCTGRDDIRLTVVQGATREEAAVRCVGLTGVGVRSSLAGMGYNTAPSDYYMCGVPAL